MIHALEEEYLDPWFFFFEIDPWFLTKQKHQIKFQEKKN
jgi:hypothetical protein